MLDMDMQTERAEAINGLMNSGQTCVRPDYYMVHASIADAYVAAL